VLIGDALHVTNPTAGQGMTMAIEDAAALARHIGPPLCAARRAAADPTAVERALSDYERERWPKNDAQIRWSHWLSRCYALEGAWAEGLTTAVFRFGASRPGQAIQRLIWSRLATRATQPPSPAQPQPAADGSAA
jgi:2-polyprenyl-6-methoxyphenol hydroxylase-like FAD-dependent oxidoreductase